MIAVADVTRAARALVGTPYRHQGRVPGARGGTDCIGVPVLVAWELGLRPRTWDVKGYRRKPDGYTLMRRLREEMGEQVEEADVSPGDVIVLDWGLYPHHVGIVGGKVGAPTLIHADNIRKKVVELRLVINPPARFVAAFRFPGVTHV